MNIPCKLVDHDVGTFLCASMNKSVKTKITCTPVIYNDRKIAAVQGSASFSVLLLYKDTKSAKNTLNQVVNTNSNLRNIRQEREEIKTENAS